MVVENELFQTPSLTAFVEASEPAKPLRLARFFPVETTDDIENIYNVVNDLPIVAASVIGFDAGTPLRSQGAAQQAMAKLTKLAHAYHLTETMILKYRNPRSRDEQDQIVAQTFQNTKRLSDGIDILKEYIRANYVYRGKFEFVDPVQKIEIKFDLDLPSGQRVTAGTPWSNADTATPLTDIETALEAYRTANHDAEPGYIVMTKKTYAAFKKCKQVRDELYTTGDAPRIIKDAEITEMFSQNGYPALEIEEGKITFEKLDGTFETKNMMDDNTFVLHSSELGSTLSGPAVEKNFAKGKFAYPVVSQDPPGEKTVVGEVTLPVLKNITGLVIASV